MFESALIRTAAKRRGRWSILPLSAAVHLIALAAVVSAQYWHVGPVTEPPVATVFFQMTVPPLPPGGGGGTPPPPEPEAEAPEPAPQPEVVVPETVQPVPELVEREVPVAVDLPATPVPDVAAGPAGSHSSGAGPWTGGDGPGFGPGPGGPGFGPGPGGPGSGPGGPGIGPGVAPTAPVRPGGAVSRPRATFAPKPEYTEMARRARAQGTVVLDVTIDASGRVEQVAVLKPLPMGLDASAVETVRRWRFEPATLNGRPVACIMTLTVHFEVQ